MGNIIHLPNATPSRASARSSLKTFMTVGFLSDPVLSAGGYEVQSGAAVIDFYTVVKSLNLGPRWAGTAVTSHSHGNGTSQASHKVVQN